jgi:hypothetical protein
MIDGFTIPISQDSPVLTLARGAYEPNEVRALAAIGAGDAAAELAVFSWWRETAMDGRTVRYLLRDGAGNHLATAPSESRAQDVIDLLNLAARLEHEAPRIEAALLAIRATVDAAGNDERDDHAPLYRTGIRESLDDAWKAIARIKGAS